MGITIRGNLAHKFFLDNGLALIGFIPDLDRKGQIAGSQVKLT
jgi:hypothetical protein